MKDRIVKKCPTCKVIKTKEEFYKNRASWDGLTSYCAECIRKINRNKKEWNRKYWYLHAKERIKSNSDSRKKYAYKEHARQKMRYAIEHGKMEQKPCVICGEEKTQGHHKDYSKPLDVVWLCTVHHGLVDHNLLII